MPGASPPRPPYSKYASRDAVVYYVLVLPAVVATAVFSISMASTPGDLVPQTAAYGGVAVAAEQILPLAILVASVYAVFSFRSSLLVTLLIGSFLVAASVANGIDFLGLRLDLGYTVFSVVASTFLALAGSNYARGIKVLGERRPDVISSGPFGYNFLGIALESAVPMVASLALVLLVGAVVAAVGVQAGRLPAPLSTLASLYLQSRVGLVFTTLFVAGALIWIMREFLEPVILHFTLSAADAKKELLSEIQPTTKSVRRIVAYRPSGGLAWGFITSAYCIGIFAALVLFLPRGELYRDLFSVLSRRPPSPTAAELLLEDAFQEAVVKADMLFAQSQDYIREIIRILWG